MTPHEEDTFRLDEVREGGGPPFSHPPQNGSGLSGSQRTESPCLAPQRNIDDQTAHDTRGFEIIS
jgi:hypothetical protein